MSKSYTLDEYNSARTVVRSRNLVQRMTEYGFSLRILAGDVRILKSRIRIGLLIPELRSRM